MFLDVNELALRKTRIRKSYAPGTLDFHSGEFRQVEPLDVRATAELVEGQIRVYGNLRTRVELVCARCLDTVVEEISRDFDLYYRAMTSMGWRLSSNINRAASRRSFSIAFAGDSPVSAANARVNWRGLRWAASASFSTVSSVWRFFLANARAV